MDGYKSTYVVIFLIFPSSNWTSRFWFSKYAILLSLWASISTWVCFNSRSILLLIIILLSSHAKNYHAMGCHWLVLDGAWTIEGVRSYLIVYFVFWLLFALPPCQDLSFLLNWSKLDLLYRIKYLQNSYKNNDIHKYDQLFKRSFQLRNHEGPWVMVHDA